LELCLRQGSLYIDGNIVYTVFMRLDERRLLP
jgi:hypothetical protein